MAKFYLDKPTDVLFKFAKVGGIELCRTTIDSPKGKNMN